MFTSILSVVSIISLVLVGLFFLDKYVSKMESGIGADEIRAVENKVEEAMEMSDYEGEIIS